MRSLRALYIDCSSRAYFHREVWPEDDVFGSSNILLTEESELLKQILFANLPSKCLSCHRFTLFNIVLELYLNPALCVHSTGQPAVEVEETEEFRDEEIEEEETESVRVTESEFNLFDYLKR